MSNHRIRMSTIIILVVVIMNYFTSGQKENYYKNSEWIEEILKNMSIHEYEDEDFPTFRPLPERKIHIKNVTCITEKLGVSYKGQKNTTQEGEPCMMWTKNLPLYVRYTRRGKDVTMNYCRNPDNDASGPWCFIERRTIAKKEFNFKTCGIPLCVETPVIETKEYKMGAPMLYNRDCPKGFKKDKKSMCIVIPEFLVKLPRGRYSFQDVGDKSTSSCYTGFQKERFISPGLTATFCNHRTRLNDTIEFPGYISPEYGDLIFMAISRSNYCPQMERETSVVYIRTEASTVCYYFYKLSNNKYVEDRRLAFITNRKDCPEGWNSKPIDSKFPFQVSIYDMNPMSSVYYCAPERAITKFPDGDYCLISLLRASATRCPKEFVKVSFHNNMLCCRQSLQKDGTNMNLFKFLNFSSVLIINNGNNCRGEVKESNLRITAVKFDAIFHIRQYLCKNCDLVKTFTFLNYTRRYFREGPRKTSLTACHYERIMNGFAYASLNGRCPPGMELAYIRYSSSSRYTRYSRKMEDVKFCTKVNYPADIQFPQGRYCIYKIGFECPPGFITNKDSLPNMRYKIIESNGHLPNFNSDSHCCKQDSVDVDFSTVKLPFVTINFEFGLPLPNSSYHCVHGLSTHAVVDDSHMCQYYPRTSERPENTIIFSTDMCLKPTFTYYGTHRISFPQNTAKYCYFYVKNNPPPGKYCVIFAKYCPTKYFDYITYHPLSGTVICCRKNISSDTKTIESSYTMSEWVHNLKEMNLLAYRGQCEIFKGYNFGRPGVKRAISFPANILRDDYKKNLTNIGVRISRYNQVSIDRCNYKKDPFNKSTTWPHGSYAFPKTLMDCPTDFKTGFFSHAMESTSPSFSHSDVIHLDGDYMMGGSRIKWGFCVKNDTTTKEKLPLPLGRYCVMRVGNKCPLDFKPGTVKFVEITAINDTLVTRNGFLPEIGIEGPFITYYFCCQTGYGDIAHSAIKLPIDSGPFYLFKFGTFCQQVEGMKITEEFICIDSEDSPQHLNLTFLFPYKVEGLTPISGSYSRGCDFQINMCYYEKDTRNIRTSTKKPSILQGWPMGSYLFVKALEQKCPPLFVEKQIPIFAKFKISQRFLNTLMFGARGDKESVLSYCERNSSALDTSYPPEVWPRGTYCVIFEKKCPQGLSKYRFKSIDNFILPTFWDTLCCKNNKVTNKDDLPFFPADQYSFFIQPTQEVHTCPSHKNMRAALINLQSEIMCYYEKNDESIEFPDGDYLLPAPSKSWKICPSGFKFVKHYHTSVTGEDVPSKVLEFCQKDSIIKGLTKFPRGNYCILTTKKTCPSNQFTTENYLVIPLYQFSDQKGMLSRYLACCQNDEKLISNIGGMKALFRLFGSNFCSYVDGMINVIEMEEATDLVQRGVIERPPYIMASKKIRICRYDQSSFFDYDAKCQCHQHATCSFNLDDVRCQCRTGFFGDGKETCVKVTSLTDKCGNVCNIKRSDCVGRNKTETPKCKCKEGYEGDGFTCNPSCNTRVCNHFSHCVVNSTDSYCECLSSSVRTTTGDCFGDLISTSTLLSGFDIFHDFNWTCLPKKSYDHIMSQQTDKTLYLFLSPLYKNNFGLCLYTDNHIALVKGKVPRDNTVWKKLILTDGMRVLLSVDEKQRWTINEYIQPYKVDIFSNAVVLYVNNSFGLSWYGRDPNSKLVSKDPVIAAYTFGVLLSLTFVAVLIFCVVRRRRMFGFNMLHETRSETNIHFLSAEDKVEIDN